MSSGTSRNNFPVNAGDQVTILGAVASISGSAPSTASVVVNSQNEGGQFTCQANDCTASQNTAGSAMSMNGKLFTTGDRVSVNGRVTGYRDKKKKKNLSLCLWRKGLCFARSLIVSMYSLVSAMLLLLMLRWTVMPPTAL